MKSAHQIKFSPFSLGILYFAITIVLGAVLLRFPFSLAQGDLCWTDSLFMSTSATCVTGLSLVDVGQFFTPFGQVVIMTLMQLGGLGIMTYTCLIFYLWRHRVSLRDRFAVSQSLLHDPSFSMGTFFRQIILISFGIELTGGVFLYLLDPIGFSPFYACFHAVSAFTNGGFSLFSDGLTPWRSDWGINIVFMTLIILGGLGFSVLVELIELIKNRLDRKKMGHNPLKMSWHSRIVLSTQFGLIFVSALFFFLDCGMVWRQGMAVLDSLLVSFFQAVTCRTAGFSTADISMLTVPSTLVMILLMFIGGSPGSCAGGIKTTTFRSLLAFAYSNMIGRRQIVVSGTAIDMKTLKNILTLTIFSIFVIGVSTLLLAITEADQLLSDMGRGMFLDILFETVSAFATVGLSAGLTPELSFPGKMIITMVMFIGRLGPILFLCAMQEWRKEENYSWPEDTLLIG